MAFALLARELGARPCTPYTEKAGLTDRYSLNGLPTAKGTFRWTDISDGELGWAGVGQGQDLVNPCGLMVYMGAIAGGGKAAEPYLIEKTELPLGFSCPYCPAKRGRLISPGLPRPWRDPMADNVEKTYGTSLFPNMDLCAKSGTAQVGDGQRAPRPASPGSRDAGSYGFCGPGGKWRRRQSAVYGGRQGFECDGQRILNQRRTDKKSPRCSFIFSTQYSQWSCS